MLEIDVEARSAAPPEAVWALLADVRSWPGWAPFDSAIRWHSTFRAKVQGTGWLMRASLTRFIRQTSDGLAREAERRSNR